MDQSHHGYEADFLTTFFFYKITNQSNKASSTTNITIRTSHISWQVIRQLEFCLSFLVTSAVAIFHPRLHMQDSREISSVTYPFPYSRSMVKAYLFTGFRLTWGHAPLLTGAGNMHYYRSQLKRWCFTSISCTFSFILFEFQKEKNDEDDVILNNAPINHFFLCSYLHLMQRQFPQHYYLDWNNWTIHATYVGLLS